ncbi:MAG: oxidoreductase [Gracilibacteraceae bacterium]|jgi:anaerobic dimethyl sulfoxide reductase subunit B (iron-sulfur subunit)|nr:oxidoreductase [Gracilibacteraceae bacterium]
MAKKALLVNYLWCTGCHSCELACQVKNNFPPGQFGIKLNRVGPWKYAPKKWQYSYFPLLTDQCHFCADRLAENKLPSCVQHCQANCLQILAPEEAARIAAANPGMIFMSK